MKNLKLQNNGVATLSTREMKDTNGGWVFWAVFAVITAVFVYRATRPFVPKGGFARGRGRGRSSSVLRAL